MNKQHAILVVEDDADINKLLCTILTKSGYETVAAFSGSEGLMQLNARGFDLVILDLMLPGITGEQLLQEIRKKSRMPVIVISAKSTTINKIELLRSGADDYIVKPFDTDEVIARVEAQLRRCFDYSDLSRQQDNILTHKDISLDIERHEVRVKGNLVILTAKEYAILELLMRHPNKVFTKQNLFESIWEDAYFSDENTVNVHISKLRSKLSEAEDYIQTLWGIGYKMCD